MPSVKPANRLHVSAIAIVAASLSLGLGAIAMAATGRSAGPQNALPAAPLPDAQHYERCLATAHTDPQNALLDAEAWHNLGGGFPAQHCAAVALVGLKKYAEAATELQALASAMMQAGPDMLGDALEQAGQAWLLAGKPTEAKAAFDAALSFRPKDPEILIDRAEAYALGGKYFDAIDDLNAVLDQTPNRVDALVYRASAYRQLGSLDLAFDDVDRALRLDPNSVPGLLERGNLRRLKNDPAGAKADWQQVEKLGAGTPAAASAQENLAHLAEQPAGQSPNNGAAAQPRKP